MSVNVQVNGRQMMVEQGTSVQVLLKRTGLDGSPCAVEVNRMLIPKRNHASHVLAEGDRVEIVTLVGGG